MFQDAPQLTQLSMDEFNLEEAQQTLIYYRKNPNLFRTFQRSKMII